MDFNRSNGHKCPCRECPEKGCGAKHNTCEKYKAWRSALDDINKERQKDYMNNMSDAKKRAIWKNKRYSRRVNYNKGR